MPKNQQTLLRRWKICSKVSSFDTEDWHMSFRPKLLEHVGTPKNMRFPRRWKRDDDLLCFSPVAAHEDFRGSVCKSNCQWTRNKSKAFASQDRWEQHQSEKSFCSYRFWHRRGILNPKPCFLPSCSYFYQEFCSFSHFSVWTQQQSMQDEIWKHANIDICRSHRHSAFWPCSKHFIAVFVKQSFDSIFGKLHSMFILSQTHQLGNPEYTTRFQKLWDFLRPVIWKSKLHYCSSCWKIGMKQLVYYI